MKSRWPWTICPKCSDCRKYNKGQGEQTGWTGKRPKKRVSLKCRNECKKPQHYQNGDGGGRPRQGSGDQNRKQIDIQNPRNRIMPSSKNYGTCQNVGHAGAIFR